MAGGTGDDGGGWIWVLILAAVGIWYYSSAEDKAAPTPQPYLAEPPILPPNNQLAAPLPVKPPPLPVIKPNYDFAEDGAYGYISAVSEENRRRGIVVGNVSLFRYLGKHEGLHRLEYVNDAGLVTGSYECASACVAIKAYRIDGSMQRVPYDTGSIIGAAFEDAIAGRLKVKPRPKPKAPPVVAEEIMNVEVPENYVDG